jgi:glycosyltransferase involved in cell wall biosynthesis
MRVLHLCSGNLFGGIETLLCSLAEHDTLAPGIGRDFAVCFDGPLRSRLLVLDARVHLLGDVRFRNPLSVRRARRALATLLRQNQFNAVICHSPWAQAIFGRTVREASVRSIFWAHGAMDGGHWLERLASRVRPDFVIANSRYTSGALDRLYPGVARDVVYPPLAISAPALSAEERAEVRRGWGTAPDAVVIIQSSRMEPWKGHRIHLDALARLNDDPRWVCWMAGAPQRAQEEHYMRELRTHAEALGITHRLRFLGERSDVARLLAAADIHCQPNTGAEPFGIAFVEALAAGLPVVTTDLGGAREIVDASCGMLIPVGDVGQLADSLHRLIADPVLRVTLGHGGPVQAKQLCDPARQLARLEEICAPDAKAVFPRAAARGMSQVLPIVSSRQ